MARWRRLREHLPVAGGLLLLVMMIVMDSARLHGSALWGTRTWTRAVMVGMSVAMAGVVMAGITIRRARDGASDRRAPIVGLTYTATLFFSFLATHRKYGSQPRVDSPFIVAALAAQVALGVAVVVFAPVMMRPGFGRRTWLKDHDPASGDGFRPAKPEHVRRSRALPSRRYHRRRG